MAPHPLLGAAREPVLLPLLKRWLADNRTPPVLLLTGAGFAGVREAALLIALSLLCENRKSHDGQACKSCPSCLRHLKGQWIDFTEIAPEGPSDASDADEGDAPSSGGRLQSLKIGQFEDLLSTQGFGALQAEFRVILISQVERMTPKVANALLKILEEPPRGWVFLLAAGDESLVLPTLRSRCQRLRLPPLSREVVLETLRSEGVPDSRAREVIEIAEGNLEFARLLCDDALQDRWKMLMGFFQSPRKWLNDLVDWAAKDPRHFEFLLTGLEVHLAKTAPRTPGPRLEAWIQTSEVLAETRRRALLPMNRKLLVQNVLMPWLELRA